MDAIQRAIMNGRHMTKINFFNQQDWEGFFSCAALGNKKIYVFGLGEGANYFFNWRNKEEIIISGVIDNDTRKQGIQLKKYFPGILSDNEQDIVIQDISVLNNYSNEEVVVLITNLLHYEEIYNQLMEFEKTNIYSLLLLESNKCREEITDKNTDENIDVGRSDVEAVNDKKIVFYTMGGYSGHGKYIVEEILKSRKDLDIVWLVREMSVETPKEIRLVYWYNRENVLYEMSTSKILIIDDNILDGYVKKDNQILIQIKHWSSITLKTFGIELANYRKQFDLAGRIKKEVEQTDYVFTGSEFDTKTFRKAYGYQGEIVEVGSPRTDILFNNRKIKSTILDRYNIASEEKLILFAPTFRIDKDTGIQTMGPNLMNFAEVKNAFEKRFGGRWKILLRLHPNVAVESNKVEKAKFIIDASDYGDSQELVAASDVVITDYSSIMFEPAFVKKPVFLFAPDRKEYIDGERELLIEYDTLPFPIAETNEQLVENIENFDKQAYEKKVTKFLEEYGVHEDGHASERAAEFVLNLFD